ncbi:MAG: hypothetical protein RR646_07795 [Erysipelotrichaceae bacterium]
MKKYQASTALIGPILLLLIGAFFIYNAFTKGPLVPLILLGIFLIAVGSYNLKMIMSIFKDKEMWKDE